MNSKILTPLQIKTIDVVFSDTFFKNIFYLTGGTALAGFYLHHRLSEDLDFFSEREFDISAINIFLKRNKKLLGYRTFDFQQSYNRNLYFLRFAKNVLKTEFTYFPFPRIEKNRKYPNVDSVVDIAANKLFTIYQRSAARDYIDLYYLMRTHHFSLHELVIMAKTKFDWHIDYLQLGTQFIKAETVTDYPTMIKKIDHRLWKRFFLDEARKLKNKVIH